MYVKHMFCSRTVKNTYLCIFIVYIWVQENASQINFLIQLMYMCIHIYVHACDVVRHLTNGPEAEARVMSTQHLSLPLVVLYCQELCSSTAIVIRPPHRIRAKEQAEPVNGVAPEAALFD